MAGLPATPLTPETRPARKGPIDRQRMPLYRVESASGRVAGACARRRGDDAAAAAIRAAQATEARVRLEIITMDLLETPKLTTRHASRSTAAGSMRAARRAGSQPASAPTAASTSAAPASVIGSRGGRP